MNNIELTSYIKKEITQYKKIKNKTEDHLAALLAQAETYPSPSWIAWSPTKELREAFELVENKLTAQKYFNEFKNDKVSLESVAHFCLYCCLSKDTKTIDNTKLSQWQTEFVSVLPQFSTALLNNVMDKLQEAKNVVTQNADITTVKSVKNKM